MQVSLKETSNMCILNALEVEKKSVKKKPDPKMLSEARQRLYRYRRHHQVRQDSNIHAFVFQGFRQKMAL